MLSMGAGAAAAGRMHLTCMALSPLPHLHVPFVPGEHVPCADAMPASRASARAALNSASRILPLLTAEPRNSARGSLGAGRDDASSERATDDARRLQQATSEQGKEVGAGSIQGPPLCSTPGPHSREGKRCWLQGDALDCEKGERSSRISTRTLGLNMSASKVGGSRTCSAPISRPACPRPL